MNFKEVAGKYGVSLVEFDHEGYGENGGGSAGNEITLKPCDEPTTITGRCGINKINQDVEGHPCKIFQSY